MDFNLVDLLLGLVFVWRVWRGWRAGFMASASTLVCLGASLAAALFCAPPLASTVAGLGWLGEPWAAPAAFGLVLFAVLWPLSGLLLPAGRWLPAKPFARVLNRALGVVPGAVNGILAAMVISVLLISLPLHDSLNREAARSVLTGVLSEPVDWAQDRALPLFEPALQRAADYFVEDLDKAHGSDHYELPYSVANAPSRPRLEARMLELLNAERLRAGGRPLVADAETLDLTRAHSRDMFARGYFAHETPEGVTPAGRLRAAGVHFRATGENLALAPNLERAHEGLMKSPGHRDNILNPAFGRVAIGIVDGGSHGLMVTQTFRN